MQITPRLGRAATRNALVAAGLRLFGEAGAKGVGIDEIIQAASVSKQTVYNHFPDKRRFAPSCRDKAGALGNGRS